MATLKPERYHLLEGDENSSTGDHSDDYTPTARETGSYHISKRIATFSGAVFVFTVVANVFLAAFAWRKSLEGTPNCATPIAQLENTHPRAWQDHTQYSNPNISEADRAWVNMDIDYIVVALHKEEAAEKGLPLSANFPWDPDYGAYMITSLHSLHCLKSLHRSNLEYRNGVKQSYSTEHLIHCLDNIRQDLVCSADDTPRYIPVDAKDSAHTGIGQYRQCKDWSKLEKWGREHTACFSYNELITHDLKEDRAYPHALRFCEADSKWLPAIRKFYNEDDDWVPVKPPPPYPAVGVPFDGYDHQRNPSAN